MSTPREVQIGIDIGGTFVDVVADDGEHRHVAKLASDPCDPLRAFDRAVDHIFDEWNIAPGAVYSIRHGSTVAVNTVLERTGAQVGLLTTAGFRDVLELGRQRRDDLYTLSVAPATPVFLAPRARRLEVTERIAADGRVVQALDVQAVTQAIHALVADGVDSLAVCLLFAHINPCHEQRIAALAGSLYPHLPVSLSHVVDPLFREYERTAATCFDAYLKPRVSAYLDAASATLRARGVTVPLQVMDSIGGVRHADAFKDAPLKLLLSGPAAAVTGAAAVASEAAHTLMSVDIGGTSADIGVIAGGDVLTQEAGLIDGFSIRTPTVDVTAIGAGGGSIAWLDDGGGLQVGPRSAGAQPGPACYALGNTRPTLTDASVVLGLLTPRTFARQGLTIDPTLAHDAVREHIAEPLGISVVDAALGMHRVANAKMAETVRQVALDHGTDPRDVTLMPLGGAGGLHGVALAEAIGARRIVVPPAPGVMAADGLLRAHSKIDATRTLMRSLGNLREQDIADAFAQLDEQLLATASAEGLAWQTLRHRDEAIVAFAGQSHTLTMVLSDGAETPCFDPGVLAERARERHQQVHGHAPVADVMLHAVRRTCIAASSALAKPTDPTDVRAHDNGAIAPEASGACIVSGASQVPGTTDATPTRRDVKFRVDQPALATRCVSRDAIKPGPGLCGPLIVEQLDSTLLVPPGWRVRRLGQQLLELTPQVGT